MTCKSFLKHKTRMCLDVHILRYLFQFTLKMAKENKCDDMHAL